jgi:hypothetical protein
MPLSGSTRTKPKKPNFYSPHVPPMEIACTVADSVERVADSQQTIDNRKSQIVNQHSDLKKQSQFAPARTGAKSFVKGDYGNRPGCGAERNKAKQSQFRQPASPRGAGGGVLCSSKIQG